MFFLEQCNTRFSHSIGAAFLSLKVLDHLKENSKYKKEITPKDRKIVLAATLLHDIGHGPFSYCFEKACCAINGKQEKSLIPSHEEWTSAIPYREIIKLKNHYCKN